MLNCILCVCVNTVDQRGWWFSREDNYFNAQDPSGCVKGYEESVTLIKDVFKSMVCTFTPVYNDITFFLNEN